MYRIIQKRKIWLTISGTAVGLSIIALFVWGLNFGIDFTGGSLLEVKFLGTRPGVTVVQDRLANLNLGSLTVQPVGSDGMILRFQDTSEAEHQQALAELDALAAGNAGSDNTAATGTAASASSTAPVSDNVTATGTAATTSTELKNIEELRFDSVGPSIGQDLKQKSVYAIFLVIIAIVIYVAWAFRKVSKPVASWKYGAAAVIALFHDVLITIGVFVILGRFYGIEINSPFVAAILTVLGYSVNDTIVVFDRIRENLPRSDEDFEGTVNTSVNQTISRSINTSLTTILVLVAIILFGGASIRDFVLALTIGIFVGTYSSIFLASPVLVIWEKMRRDKLG